MSDFKNFEKYPDFYLMEKQRIQSFKRWPFDEKTVCNITKMAEAGFYWSGNKREIDTATCFVCQKTLDGWEATDDPWKEHTKHAPQCLFVKYGRAEKELTLEEFLRIFSTVIKQKMLQDSIEIKKELREQAENELNAFNIISKK